MLELIATADSSCYSESLRRMFRAEVCHGFSNLLDPQYLALSFLRALPIPLEFVRRVPSTGLVNKNPGVLTR